MDGLYVLDRDVHGIGRIVMVRGLDLYQRLNKDPMDVPSDIPRKKGHRGQASCGIVVVIGPHRDCGGPRIVLARTEPQCVHNLPLTFLIRRRHGMLCAFVPLCLRLLLSRHNHRHPLPTTDAEGGETEMGAAVGHDVEQRDQDPGAACAYGMSERDRAAVGVDDLGVQA